MCIAIGSGVIYSLLHFAISGIRFPLQSPNSGQVAQEMEPLSLHLAHGGAVTTTNPRQYGPTFFFVLHPLLRLFGHDASLFSHWLYGLQLVALVLGFLGCVLSVRLWLESSGHSQLPWIYLVVLLGLLWLNFSPMYYILAVKNVEMWELGLLAVGLYAYLRGWRFAASACIAAAALTKLLPFLFLCYFLLKDRRMFWYCCMHLALMLTVSQYLYGPEMGYLYVPHRFAASVGNTWALAHHENMSLTGMIVKACGGWQTAGTYSTRLPGQMRIIASVTGHLAQFACLAWMAWTFVRTHDDGHPRWVLWSWSFTSVMMLLLSPQLAFEYMTLSLLAFSFVLVALASDDRLWLDRRLWWYVSGAVLLVANVLPRQAINRLFLIEWLNRWSGNTHFTLSEGYQYYGFPFLGLVLLLAALWRIRRGWTSEERLAGVPESARHHQETLVTAQGTE